jgi:AraC-like DNA-binding protein
MKIVGYRPDQPFFETTTDQFISQFGSSSGLLAQYYSFIVSSNTEDAVVAVPDGTIDILFHCSSSSPEALICGSVKKGKHIHFDTRGIYFGARFYPGAAERLLGCPLDEFTEQEIHLDDVLTKSNDLVERISDADSFQERVEMFEAYHCSNNDKKPLPFMVEYILEKINRTRGDIRIQELADETGYSTRHINNLFKKHVGISPKLFLRIVRFQRGIDLLRSKGKSDFAGLAEEAGYYDQAHFINEFKEFSLTTPNQFSA